MITGTDFITIPTQDAARARAFYVDTLGLRPDSHAQNEVWAGPTCLAIFNPAEAGLEFSPSSCGHIALAVDDVDAARVALEAKGVKFSSGTVDTTVCHMAIFADPDGNSLMLHKRYAPASN